MPHTEKSGPSSSRNSSWPPAHPDRPAAPLDRPIATLDRERQRNFRRPVCVALVFLLLLSAAAMAGGPAFRTIHLLEDHFARYGSEFGQINMQQYLHYAQDLRDSAPGKNILVSKRPDGSGAKFDVKRGWFVAFDGNGTLRTFFIPKDGLRYFDRQQKSPAPPE